MAGEARANAPRTEKVLPGVWRLRLPLPWPGVPHGNAWAVAAGDGIVLFDTGMGGKGRLRQLDLALAQAGFGVEDVGLLVCTHSHTDHYGLAAPIVEAAGCELWMHPAWEHVRLLADDPAAALEHRLEVARQSGVPVGGAGALPRVAQRRRRDRDRRDPGRARPRARPRGRGRDRPRRLAGLRDPRPRALARRPAPARAQADDLRRPPARPHRALLRLRPHARPGRRIPRQPRRGRAARDRTLPARPRPPLPRPGGEDRRGAAPGRRAARQGPRGARRAASGPPSRSSPRSSAPRTSTARPAPGSCRSSSPASTTWRSSARSSAVEGTDPQRWKLPARPIACRRWPASLTSARSRRRRRSSSRCSPTTAATPRSRRCARSELEREGEPAPNGVGAIRGLSAVGPPLREEVLAYEPAEPLLLQAALGAAGARPRRHRRADPERGRHQGRLRGPHDADPAAGRRAPSSPRSSSAIKQLLGGVAKESERRAREWLRAGPRPAAAHAVAGGRAAAAAQPRAWRSRCSPPRSSSSPRVVAYELLKRPADVHNAHVRSSSRRSRRRRSRRRRRSTGRSTGSTRPAPATCRRRGSSRRSASSGATPSGRCSSSRRSTSAASSTSSTTTATAFALDADTGKVALGTADRPPQRLLAGLLPRTASTSSTSSPATSSSSTRRPARRSGNSSLPGRAESSPLVHRPHRLLRLRGRQPLRAQHRSTATCAGRPPLGGPVKSAPAYYDGGRSTSATTAAT